MQKRVQSLFYLSYRFFFLACNWRDAWRALGSFMILSPSNDGSLSLPLFLARGFFFFVILSQLRIDLKSSRGVDSPCRIGCLGIALTSPLVEEGYQSFLRLRKSCWTQSRRKAQNTLKLDTRGFLWWWKLKLLTLNDEVAVVFFMDSNSTVRWV